VTLPGYISYFIRILREKHASIIRQSSESPEFLVFNPR
jgi:hypothetical protein